MPGAIDDLSESSIKESTFVPLPPRKPFQPSLRYPSSRKTIYDRNLNRTRGTEISLASFSYLFNQLITYHQSRSPSVSELESRLNRAGYPIGVKLLDLLLYRQPRTASRPTRLLELLQFIHGTLWKALFGRNADALEQSTSKKNEYMIVDNEPVMNTYISIPKEISQLNCTAFLAGIIEGLCDAAAFSTDGVTAHWAGEGNEMWPGKTIFLIRFKDSVVEREEAIKAGSG